MGPPFDQQKKTDNNLYDKCEEKEDKITRMGAPKRPYAKSTLLSLKERGPKLEHVEGA